MGRRLVTGLVAILSGCTFDTSGLAVEFGVDSEEVNRCAAIAGNELRREFLDRQDTSAYCRRFVVGALDKMEECLAEGGDGSISYGCEHLDVYSGNVLGTEEAVVKCVEGMREEPQNEYSGMGGGCTGYGMYEVE